MREPAPILVTGATGYVGSKLVDELQSRGHAVRTLSRRGAGAGDARKGDVLSGEGLPEALAGVENRVLPRALDGQRGDFAAKDRQAAVNFAEAAANADVERVVYLGGLGSERLRASAQPPRGRPSCCARGWVIGSSTCAPR